MGSNFDVIVIGVGGMGAAACYHLARNKQRVLGLEQFDIPNEMGSSHGVTRMFRYAYYESPAYVPMVRRSIGLWRDLAEAYGEPLVFVTGTLDAGSEGNEVFEGALAASREHNLAHDVLSGPEINQRFPGFNLPKNHIGLFQPDGGFLACERATLAHVVLAQRAGAELHARETVSGWEQLSSGSVRVRTDRSTYDAGKLVIAAGPWISELVPQLKQFAEPERQVTAWVQPTDPVKFAPGKFPVTILMVEEGPYYFVPIWGAPGLKMGLHHHFRERGTVPALSRAPSAEDEAIIRQGLKRYTPEANGPFMALRTCFYTMTPDLHFIIDTLPGHDNVIVASACAGHGYKFAPVVGEMVAGFVTGKRSVTDPSMFSLKRFASIL